MMRLLTVLLAVAVMSGCNINPPVRDVFTPPYAEKGCFAHLYAGTDFAAPQRELDGPAFVEAAAETPAVGSIVLGPHAHLTGFPETLFRGERTLVLDPGAQVSDASLVDFGRVQSYILRCKA